MLDGISNFEQKRVKNLVNCSFHCSSALCRTPTLLRVPAQNRREKHRMTFTKVVEGCFTYNFCIYRFCRTVQLIGETRSQSRVDRLKNSSAALQSAAGAPGALPVWSAPRAVLRQSCPPRRPCGSSPTASRSGPWSPSRRPSLERKPHLPGRTAPRWPPVHSRSRVHAGRGGRRTVALKPRPIAAPALKAEQRPEPYRPRPVRSADRCTPASCPCARSRAPPPLAHFAAIQYLLAVPHGFPNLPAPTVPPPRPERRRTEQRRGQAPWAPPAGHPPMFPHTSVATNRSMMSPSTFSTPSPAESPTGMAQFRRAAPPSMPRDHIASLSLIPGCFSWTRDLFAIETEVSGTCQ
jgi:hypothetical protein